MLFVTFSLRGDRLRVMTDDAVSGRGGRPFEERRMFDESVADLVVRTRGVLLDTIENSTIGSERNDVVEEDEEEEGEDEEEEEEEEEEEFNDISGPDVADISCENSI